MSQSFEIVIKHNGKESTNLPLIVNVTGTDLLITNRYDQSEIISIPLNDSSLNQMNIIPATAPKKTNNCPKCKEHVKRYSPIYYKHYDLSLFLCDDCYTKQTACCTCHKSLSSFSNKAQRCSDCRRLFCYPKHIKGCAGCGNTYCDDCPHSCHGC